MSESGQWLASEQAAAMSASGQKQTSARVRVMSALPAKADIGTQRCPLWANSGLMHCGSFFGYAWASAAATAETRAARPRRIWASTFAAIG